MRYALIGDSHSQIIFPALKALLPGDVVLSVSKPGWSESKFLSDESTLQALTQARADIVIFALGGNNFDFTNKYTGFINQLLNRARIAGSKRILWIGPFPSSKADVNSRHEKTRNQLLSILPNFNDVVYIDGYPLADVRNSHDGVHFDRSTYQQVAKYVVQLLKDLPFSQVEAPDFPAPATTPSTTSTHTTPTPSNTRTYVLAGAASMWFLAMSLILRKIRQKRM